MRTPRFFFHLKFHTVTPWRKYWACAAEPLQAYNTPPESALGSVETSRTTRQIDYILGARSVHNQPIRSAVAQILSQQKAVNKPPHHRRPNRSQRIVRGLPPALLLRAAQAVLSLGGASRRISVPTCSGSPAMHLAAYRPKSTVELTASMMCSFIIVIFLNGPHEAAGGMAIVQVQQLDASGGVPTTSLSVSSAPFTRISIECLILSTGQHSHGTCATELT